MSAGKFSTATIKKRTQLNDFIECKLAPEPVDTTQSGGFIVDWQQWGRGIGPFDVAYLIALFWFPERRQRMERELVKYYHSILIDNGVSGYNWEQCWFDYRLGAINNLLVPFWSWVDLGENWGWHRWYQIEKGMLAFEDLGCDELLQGSLTG